MLKQLASVFVLMVASSSLFAQELIIGSEYVKPGIRFIFEGAIKDEIKPLDEHLPEHETDIHIEARVNWESDESMEVPEGTVRGGFVPYLAVHAVVTNEESGESVEVDLTAHINFIDNFHYARNIKLPGEVTDLYSVVFTVTPPSPSTLATHRDWYSTYGEFLMEEVSFEYSKVDFEEIALATRN